MQMIVKEQALLPAPPAKRLTEAGVANTKSFDELVQRYLGFAKKAAENVIKLAETLCEAEEELSDDEFENFCEAVGLDRKGSTYRKLKAIGQKASRFEPFIERLPSSWTTLYKLAQLAEDQFDRVAEDEAFGCNMTAKQVREALSAGGRASSGSI